MKKIMQIDQTQEKTKQILIHTHYIWDFLNRKNLEWKKICQKNVGQNIKMTGEMALLS